MISYKAVVCSDLTYVDNFLKTLTLDVCIKPKNKILESILFFKKEVFNFQFVNFKNKKIIEFRNCSGLLKEFEFVVIDEDEFLKAYKQARNFQFSFLSKNGKRNFISIPYTYVQWLAENHFTVDDDTHHFGKSENEFHVCFNKDYVGHEKNVLKNVEYYRYGQPRDSRYDVDLF